MYIYIYLDLLLIGNELEFDEEDEPVIIEDIVNTGEENKEKESNAGEEDFFDEIANR